jgi:hypothetical protein
MGDLGCLSLMLQRILSLLSADFYPGWLGLTEARASNSPSSDDSEQRALTHSPFLSLLESG